MPTSTNGKSRAVATAAAPAPAFTQMSLARLLGVGPVGEPGPSSANVTVTLQMSAASTGEGQTTATVAQDDAAPDVEFAAHERARSKKRKPPLGPRGRAKAARITIEAKNVSQDHRLRDFPNQGLKTSAGKLFCQPCAITLPNIKGSIANHLSTQKHKHKLEVYMKRMQADSSMRTELSEYFQSNSDEAQVSLVSAHVTISFSPTWSCAHNHTQANLDVEVHLFRLRTVETFLTSGTPLTRLEYFRPLIERAGLSLTHHSHMRAYVPKIEAKEINMLKKEIQGQHLCVAFDGTTRAGEAINVTGRWCSANFCINTRLLRFATAKHHLKAPQFASLITRVLCTDLSLDPDYVACFSRDSVALNGAACRLICQSTFNSAENLLCICHTLNNAGGQIELPTLTSFMTPWLDLVGGRHPHIGARDLWRDAVAPQVVPGFSNTRWYAKAEIQFVMAENFQKIPGFLRRLDEFGYGDSTRKKMQSFFDDGETALQLKAELAAMLDVRQLIRTTYELEGDRLEILLVYQRIEELRAFGRALKVNQAATILPNLDGALRASVKLATGTKMSKFFHGFGQCAGKIISTVGMVDSTLYPGQERPAYTVKYDSDGATEDLEEEEIRPLVSVKDMPQRASIVAGLIKAFDYLERRITDECDEPYKCAHMYKVCVAT